MKSLIICFAITIALFVYVISDKLNDPRLITMLIIMPFFFLAVLFAVFGKDLFKKNTNVKPKNGDVKCLI